MGRIPQQQLTEFERGLRANDRTLEPAADEDRQVTTVVNVRMGKKYGPNPGSIEGEFLLVPLPELLRPLKQTAINKSLRPFMGEQIARACDSASCPTKFDLHV